MCGIVGWFSSYTINKKKFKNMLDSLSHRGPDDEGYFFNKNMTVGLGHKRLSIIDPVYGHQPMATLDEKIWITFNGAIFNYLELRRDLLARGHILRTSSDTEVVLYSYKEWGEKCVDKLNGMFAFVIYDVFNNKFWGARDRIGEKPFYYYYDKSNFIFASEIKSLLASKIIPPELNAEALYDYLTFQFYLGNKTLFKNIIELEPGHFFTFDLFTHKLTIKQYWDISFDEVIEDKDEQFFIDKLKALIDDSVALRLRSDVTLGSYLSGGIDSSGIAALNSKYLIDKPLHTFTGKFLEGDGFDETKYAKEVATQIKSIYHEIVISDKDFLESIYDIVWFMDEPEAGPGVFSQYKVANYAQNYVKVVLDGQGGDEIFVGYPRYFLAYYEKIFKKNIQHGQKYYKDILNNMTDSLVQLSGYESLVESFWADGVFDEDAKRYFRLMNRFSSNTSIFNIELINRDYSPFEEFKKIFSKHNTSIVNKMSYFDIKAFLPSLLHVEDRACMANALESRAPLLDHRIIEFVAKIPPYIKFKNGTMKYLLKKVFENIIPDSIVKRKDKKGFPTPVNIWFKSTLNDWIKELLSDKKTLERGLYNEKELSMLVNGTTTFGRALWGVVNLELWFRQFID